MKKLYRQLNKVELTTLLEQAKEVKKEAEYYRKTGNISKSFKYIWGICWNIDQYNDIDLAWYWLSYNVTKFPNFSGKISFPVKAASTDYPYNCPVGMLQQDNPIKAYKFITNKWKGNYGDNRMELLDWMIETLTAQVEQYDK